jgi:cyclopropane-fatty-acyl-phospholipid synthase
VSNNYKRLTEEILGLAGIKINGSDPWDIQVHNEGFFRRAITEGELGVGESYMDGWWDAEKVDELIYKILKAKVDEKIMKNLSFLLRMLLASLINLQSNGRAYIVGEKHYDLGNDLFVNMLDKRMNYSCGYWKNARDLDEAQRDKLELICRKLYMKPGMNVLDIGCGWSAFGKYAAEKLFVIEDLHNIGADYDKTLMAWYNNFVKNRGKIKDNYSDRFFRMWKYFLLSCAGSFRARRNQCWQIVMSKDGVEGGYQSIRAI